MNDLDELEALRESVVVYVQSEYVTPIEEMRGLTETPVGKLLAALEAKP